MEDDDSDTEMADDGTQAEGNPWGPSVLKMICVTIKQSYNRGCTIA